ncbi:hypothetical protein RQP46_008934 [Phenoliferia psychrophenolica]
MSASSTSPPTFSTLPPELKARIVELASIQDAAFRAIKTSGNDWRSQFATSVREWWGRSLVALAETSKELNLLASAHLFRTITTKQVSRSLDYLLLHILPRHGSAVRVLDMLEEDVVEATLRPRIVSTFSVFLLLPLLNEVHLDSSSAIELFGSILALQRSYTEDLPTPSSQEVGAQQKLARDAFRNGADRLQAVKLMCFEPDEVDAILDISPNVTSINLYGIYSTNNRNMVYLPATLASRANLQRLSVTAMKPKSELESSWISKIWEPPLKSLHFTGIPLTPDLVPFVEKFAPSLQSLSIQSEFDPEITPFPSFQSPFPNLTHLSLDEISTTAATVILTSLVDRTQAASPVARAPLRVLDLRLGLTQGDWAITTEEGEKLASACALFKTLQNISILDLEDNSSADWVTRATNIRDIISLNSRSDAFVRLELTGRAAPTERRH